MLNDDFESHKVMTKLKKGLKNAKELPFVSFYIVISTISAYFLSSEFDSYYLTWFFYILVSCFGIASFCLVFACILYGIKSLSLSFHKDSQIKAIASLKNTSFSLLFHTVALFVVYLIWAIVDTFLI
ncbi:MAG: hypothetical protein R3Y63_12195 [Eubacteriales bacterium]